MWTIIAIFGTLFLVIAFVGAIRKPRSGRPLKNYYPAVGDQNERKPYYEYADWKELVNKGSLHGKKIDI